MFQERLSTSIRYIKSEKLRQKNYNECLDNFVMKKTKTKSFELFTVLCSALIRWL